MKTVKYSLLIIFLVLSTTFFAQTEYHNAEGLYKVSKMEQVSGFYLLKDKTFLYHAVFGNADLEFWGNYELENNQLTLKPDTFLMDEFEFYGTTTKNDSLQVYFLKPQLQNFKITVQSGSVKKEFPSFKKDDQFTSVTLPKTKNNQLIVTYNSLENTTVKTLKIQLNDTTNEVRILHNYYASMIRKFVKAQPVDLINSEYKTKNKEKISEKLIKRIKRRISRKRKFTSFVKEGKQYDKLSILELK